MDLQVDTAEMPLELNSSVGRRDDGRCRRIQLHRAGEQIESPGDLSRVDRIGPIRIPVVRQIEQFRHRPKCWLEPGWWITGQRHLGEALAVSDQAGSGAVRLTVEHDLDMPRIAGLRQRSPGGAHAGPRKLMSALYY